MTKIGSNSTALKRDGVASGLAAILNQAVARQCSQAELSRLAGEFRFILTDLFQELPASFKFVNFPVELLEASPEFEILKVACSILDPKARRWFLGAAPPEARSSMGIDLSKFGNDSSVSLVDYLLGSFKKRFQLPQPSSEVTPPMVEDGWAFDKLRKQIDESSLSSGQKRSLKAGLDELKTGLTDFERIQLRRVASDGIVNVVEDAAALFGGRDGVIGRFTSKATYRQIWNRYAVYSEVFSLSPDRSMVKRKSLFQLVLEGDLISGFRGGVSEKTAFDQAFLSAERDVGKLATFIQDEISVAELSRLSPVQQYELLDRIANILDRYSIGSVETRRAAYDQIARRIYEVGLSTTKPAGGSSSSSSSTTSGASAVELPMTSIAESTGKDGSTIWRVNGTTGDSGFVRFTVDPNGAGPGKPSVMINEIFGIKDQPGMGRALNQLVLSKYPNAVISGILDQTNATAILEAFRANPADPDFRNVPALRDLKTNFELEMIWLNGEPQFKFKTIPGSNEGKWSNRLTAIVEQKFLDWAEKIKPGSKTAILDNVIAELARPAIAQQIKTIMAGGKPEPLRPGAPGTTIVDVGISSGKTAIAIGLSLFGAAQLFLATPAKAGQISPIAPVVMQVEVPTSAVMEKSGLRFVSATTLNEAIAKGRSSMNVFILEKNPAPGVSSFIEMVHGFGVTPANGDVGRANYVALAEGLTKMNPQTVRDYIIPEGIARETLIPKVQEVGIPLVQNYGSKDSVPVSIYQRSDGKSFGLQAGSPENIDLGYRAPGSIESLMRSDGVATIGVPTSESSVGQRVLSIAESGAMLNSESDRFIVRARSLASSQGSRGLVEASLNYQIENNLTISEFGSTPVKSSPLNLVGENFVVTMSLVSGTVGESLPMSGTQTTLVVTNREQISSMRPLTSGLKKTGVAAVGFLANTVGAPAMLGGYERALNSLIVDPTGESMALEFAKGTGDGAWEALKSFLPNTGLGVANDVGTLATFGLDALGSAAGTVMGVALMAKMVVVDVPVMTYEGDQSLVQLGNEAFRSSSAVGYALGNAKRAKQYREDVAKYGYDPLNPNDPYVKAWMESQMDADDWEAKYWHDTVTAIADFRDSFLDAYWSADAKKHFMETTKNATEEKWVEFKNKEFGWISNTEAAVFAKMEGEQMVMDLYHRQAMSVDAMMRETDITPATLESMVRNMNESPSRGGGQFMFSASASSSNDYDPLKMRLNDPMIAALSYYTADVGVKYQLKGDRLVSAAPDPDRAFAMLSHTPFSSDDWRVRYDQKLSMNDSSMWSNNFSSDPLFDQSSLSIWNSAVPYKVDPYTTPFTYGGVTFTTSTSGEILMWSPTANKPKEVSAYGNVGISYSLNSESDSETVSIGRSDGHSGASSGSGWSTESAAEGVMMMVSDIGPQAYTRDGVALPESPSYSIVDNSRGMPVPDWFAEAVMKAGYYDFIRWEVRGPSESGQAWQSGYVFDMSHMFDFAFPFSGFP